MRDSLYEGCLYDYSIITEDILLEFYNTNQDFKDYIDRYIDKKEYQNKEQLFSLAETKEVYLYYKNLLK